MELGEIANADAVRYGKPLDGVRVLAIEQMQALPYATQLLRRFGAEVVKIEPPGKGESARQALPMMRDPEGRQVGNTYLRNNLGKRTIGIDLKHPAGRDLVLRLAPHFDIVGQNFKSGTVERLGIAYDDIVKVHPSVIYVSVSGFGTTLPTEYDGWPAYAPVAEAMASLYTYQGEPTAPPVVSPMGTLGDTGTAVFTALGILAALRHRDRTGEGQHVDVAMLDAMVAMADAGINYWSMGLYGGATAPLINHSFRANDGYFIIQCARRHQFEALARTIGHPEWVDDPRIPDAPSWFEHLDDIIRPGIESWACNMSREDASRALAEAGVAVGPVNRAGDVIQNRHVRDHNMIVSMPRTDDENLGPVLTVGNPIKLSKMAEGPETRVPWVGEHTDEVLREELGLTDDELKELRADGAIG
ncbi:MAG TPA: CaiB/BaiF CoA-transferase family protein [Acidimicrobiia bacterium]|nr:CaiB/BaiF CoA-transferase family protein [Acidimicrobiia bacterium]